MKKDYRFGSEQRDVHENTILEPKNSENESDALLKAILEAQQIGKIGTWVFHVNQNKIYWSDELYRFLGIAPGEPPNIEEYMKVVHPDDRQKVAESMAKAMQGEIYRSEQRILRANGQDLVVLSSAGMIYDDSGRPLRIVGVVQDITDRKRAEEDIKIYQHHLEDLVWERTAELAVAKEEAERANQAKSDFLSSMSHELRTPLNGILGYAQMLKRSATLSAADKQGLQIIHQSGQHLLTLINDILDLSKIEAGKMELYPQDLHLGSLLDTVVGIIRMRAQEKDLFFVYEPDERLPVGVQADEKRLRQVLINLLGNAVKFTKRGQVTLNVSRQPPPPTPPPIRRTQAGGGKGLGVGAGREALPLQVADVTLRFEIIDTGVGMTPQQLATIFLPFEQVGDAKQRAKGTGLGLAITRQLVNLMGSQVHVGSELGKGSRFWFDLTLPVITTKKKEEEEAPINGHITGYQGAKRTILVVDDKKENRLVLSSMLSPLGFEIVEGENGQQEVELTRQIKPDLILTDLMMPVMNGFEAVKVIRQFAPELPIIAISASVFEMDQQKSRVAGCDAFLPKPVDQQLLLALIGQQLGVEWIYEDVKYNEETQEDEPADAARLVPPPAEELEALYELAILGRVSALRKRLVHIEQLDKSYAPFANKLRQLAREFEDEKIVALVEGYLDGYA